MRIRLYLRATAAMGLWLTSPPLLSAQGVAIPDSVLSDFSAEVGTWVADNSAYVDGNEPFDSYVTEWRWDPVRTSLTGRMYGITNGKETEVFWTFRQFWHGGEQGVVVQQIGRDGTFGTGVRAVSGSETAEVIQTFYGPDGSTRRERHLTRYASEEHHTTSFRWVDGEWVEGRSYTWIRTENGSDPVPGLEEGDGRRELRKEITIAAPAEQVWAVWTDPEAMRFVSRESNIELRVGGPYEWFMDLPPDENGRRGGEGCRVLAFLPHRVLAFDWSFPPSIPSLRGSQAKTQVVVRFEEADAGTRLRFSQIGWQEGEDWDAGYAYFDGAWDYVLQAMKEHLEGDSRSTR